MARVSGNIPLGWSLVDESTLVWIADPRITIIKQDVSNYWVGDNGPFSTYVDAFNYAQSLIAGNPLDSIIAPRRFAPSIRASSREEYLKRLKDSNKKANERDAKGRIPHSIVRGGRGALGKPLDQIDFIPLSTESKRRLLRITPEFGARTQSLALRKKLQEIQYLDEANIRHAIHTLRNLQPTRKLGFRVPYFEQPLIDAGMPPRAAAILIERARHTFFVSKGRLKSTQVTGLMGILRQQSQQDISLGTQGDRFSNKEQHVIIMSAPGRVNLTLLRLHTLANSFTPIINEASTAEEIEKHRAQSYMLERLDNLIAAQNASRRVLSNTFSDLDKWVNNFSTLVEVAQAEQLYKLLNAEVAARDNIGSLNRVCLAGSRKPIRLSLNERATTEGIDTLIDNQLAFVKKATEEYKDYINRIGRHNERVRFENRKNTERGLPTKPLVEAEDPPPEVNYEAKDHVEWLFNLIERSAREEARLIRMDPVSITVTFGSRDFLVTLPQEGKESETDLQHSDESAEAGSSTEIGYRTLEGITLEDLPAVLAKLARRKKRRGRDLKPFRSNPNSQSARENPMKRRVKKKASSSRRRVLPARKVAYSKVAGLTRKQLKRLKTAAARTELARRLRKKASSARKRAAPRKRVASPVRRRVSTTRRRVSTTRRRATTARRPAAKRRSSGRKVLSTWQRFQKKLAGRGLSVKKMASMYRSGKKGVTSRKAVRGRSKSRTSRARRNSSALELELDNPGSFLASDPWHPVYEQVLGQFGVSEALTHGLQPVNRRNGKKKKKGSKGRRR